MNITRRTLLHSAVFTGISVAFPAMAASIQSVGGPAFGSTWRVVTPVGPLMSTIKESITAVVENVDSAMSPWQTNSEISRFNRARNTDWHPLSVAPCAVLAESLEISTLTGGAFDPSIGPLVNRFGFGPIRQGGGVIGDLILNPNAAKKRDPELTLDLCGIAKGYALDQMVMALGALGLNDFLIELGGEISARGQHPDGRPWTIGIEQPGTAPVQFQRIIAPGLLALATSGTMTNGFRAGERHLNHIIDPRQNRPVDNQIASVSVLAATAMWADALATALTVMGVQDGAKLAERENISALFLTGTGPEFTEIMTGSFADYVLI